MKNFFRKVAFGISPNEKVTTDELYWSLNQVDEITDFSKLTNKRSKGFRAPTFSLNKNRDNTLWSPGHHPNRNGHKRIANELFDYIKKIKLL